MSKFENRFFKVIKEDIEEQIAPEDITPEGDDVALANSFEDETPADEFGVDPRLAGFKQKYIDQGKGWIVKIEEFSTWLNAMEEGSLNKQLIDLDIAGGPFEGISTETKRITAIAADLAKLSETLKGVVLTLDRK